MFKPHDVAVIAQDVAIASETLALTVNGQRYERWEDIRVTREIDRMAIRLNLGQIVVDVAGQHRIAADNDRAFLERRQWEVTRRCQVAFRHGDVEVSRHAVDLARDPDVLPAFIPLAVDGESEGFGHRKKASNADAHG